ncbi:MAG: protein-glutamate O-methyltransferase CheR [Firmicutes bacterium]|nr:protein-glutamate O-methyltransferase CheR [Bacillota bacterium]
MMTDVQFQRYCDLIYYRLGIKTTPGKRDALQSKIDKLLHQNRLKSYEEYYDLLINEDNGKYWPEFVHEITVHESSFFRENNHFEFIRTQLRHILDSNPRIMKNKEIRAWSAGCSSGEEAYTLAMVFREWLPAGIKIIILATDVSAHSLAQAQTGLYPHTIKKEMDPYFLLEYFTYTKAGYQIKPKLQELITFRRFNLIDPFPFQQSFDLIFCRNVMIYFDNAVQEELIRKFYEVLIPGGILFVGHSESLLARNAMFKYLQPTVYQREK